MQKKYRLTKRAEFHKIYRSGRSTANRQFVVYYMQQPQVEHFQMGVSVSKKIGNAVVRNRMRRWVKEIVRLQAERVVPHVQFIIIVRKASITMDYTSLSKSVNHVLKKAKLLT